MNERLRKQLVKEYNLVANLKNEWVDVTDPLYEELSKHAKALVQIIFGEEPAPEASCEESDNDEEALMEECTEVANEVEEKLMNYQLTMAVMVLIDFILKKGVKVTRVWYVRLFAWWAIPVYLYIAVNCGILLYKETRLLIKCIKHARE